MDYVVIGAGSAGSVITRRLVDAGHRVCLLEAGGDDNSFLVQAPMGYAITLPTKINNWAFETVPQVGLNGRRGYQPRGKVLGGSSSINAMIYVRGHAADYDDWAAFGNAGWSWQEVLPYFKRAENNQNFNGPLHGQGGPLHVESPKNASPFNDYFFEAAALNQHALNPDFNGESQEGVGMYQTTTKDGQRFSAAKGYLYDILKHPNLKLVTKAHSSKLLFDGKKCVGVEYHHHGKVKEVRAEREVICCAGAFGTPHLLQLSGIGPASLLQKHGIKVLHDLPGVGQNLQDHPDYIAAYKANTTDLMGYSIKGFGKMIKELWRYKTKKSGLFASTVAESGGFLKTDPALDRPDLQLHFVSGIADNHNRTSHWGHGFSCHVCVLRPKSVGSVEIASSDPMQAPLIDPALLAHDDDMATLIKGYKIQQQIMQSPPLAQHVTEVLYKPHLSDDAAIEEEIRNRADTVYHPVGTAKMGMDTMAVVSPKDLCVYGVEGLRVADASIMPTLIGGNTNAPTIMIGEKASDMILGQ